MLSALHGRHERAGFSFRMDIYKHKHAHTHIQSDRERVREEEKNLEDDDG